METNESHLEKKSDFFSFLDPSFTISWNALISIALAVFLLKLLIAATTTGTTDVYGIGSYANIIQEIGGSGIYEKLQYYNHPPFIVHFLNVLKMLESMTTIGFPFWFRFASSLADLGILVVIFKLSQLNTGLKISSLSILLMMIAPVSLLVAGFHGNTDPILVFFLVLTVYLIEVDENVVYSWLPEVVRKYFIKVGLTNLCLAGFAYGLSTNIKVVAFIVAPCIFFYLSNKKKRLEFTLISALTWIFLSMPYILQSPKYIIKHTFNYNSFYGFWGIPRVLVSNFSYDHWINTFYSSQGKFLIIGIIILSTLFMNFAGKKPPLFVQIGFIFSIFLVLTNGFGVQYLFWLIPWVLALGAEIALTYYLASGVFIFMVYNYWSGSFPWDFASADAKPYANFIIFYEYVTWGVILSIAVCYLVSIVKMKKFYTQEDFNFLPRKVTFLIATIISVFLPLMAINDLFVKKGFYLYTVDGQTPEIRKKQAKEATLIIISSFYSTSGLYEKSINTCNQILALNPNSADAYNNMCVAYNNLKEWEKAIEVGKKALAINPSHQLAKNNLEWAKNNLLAIGKSPADSEELLKQLKTPPGYFNASNFVNVGLELIQKGDNLNAAVACEKALEKDSKHIIAYNNLCIAYNNLFMYEEAEIACKKAIELSPSFELAKNNYNFTLSRKSDNNAPKVTAQTYINLALSFLNVGDFKKSIGFSEKALTLEPSNSIAYNNLCVAYNGLQEWDKAIIAAEKALAIDPNFTLARNNLNWAKSQKK